MGKPVLRGNPNWQPVSLPSPCRVATVNVSCLGGMEQEEIGETTQEQHRMGTACPAHSALNQNYINGALTEMKYLGFVGTAAWETQIQEALEFCSTQLQNGVIKAKTEGYISTNCLSRIEIGAGQKYG